MVVTETYKNNAINFKKIIKKAFGLSKDSYERLCSYIDDPTLLFNDKTKQLFEKYNDEIVDYRIPVETEKILKSDNPVEIYYVLEALNDLLFDNFSEYRTLDNNCDISAENLLSNKFILFGQNRKLWKFLCSYSEKIASSFIEKYKSVGIMTPKTEYSFGPLVKSIEKYSKELEGRTTLLKTKIDKLFNDYSNATSDLKVVTEMVNETFRIVADIIGAKNLPNPYGYKAYLSYNMCDWLLASTGEEWESCISFNSGMCYGLGLTGLMACPDWGMVEIVKNSNKEVHGLVVPHIVCRTWTVFGNNDKFNIVNWYPHDIRSRTNNDIELKNKDIILANIRNSRFEELRSSSWYKPFYMENGAVPFIYSDCYDLKLAKSGNSMRFELNGEKSGIFTVFVEEKDGEKVLVRNSKKISFGNICGALGENRRSCIRSVLGGNKTLFEYINLKNSEDDEICDDTTEWCSWCQEYVNEEVESVPGLGNVCMSCLHESGDFFYCDDCETYYRSEDGCEEVDGRLICNNCLDRDYSLCTVCDTYHLSTNGNTVEGDFICYECFDDAVSRDDIIECDNCGEYYFKENIEQFTVIRGNELVELSCCKDCLPVIKSKEIVVSEEEIEKMKEVLKKQNEEVNKEKQKASKGIS